jgi:hypothetical protein
MKQSRCPGKQKHILWPEDSNHRAIMWRWRHSEHKQRWPTALQWTSETEIAGWMLSQANNWLTSEAQDWWLYFWRYWRRGHVGYPLPECVFENGFIIMCSLHKVRKNVRVMGTYSSFCTHVFSSKLLVEYQLNLLLGSLKSCAANCVLIHIGWML